MVYMNGEKVKKMSRKSRKFDKGMRASMMGSELEKKQLSLRCETLMVYTPSLAFKGYMA
jgi:hypothetical protein